MSSLQLFFALIFFSQDQGVAPYSLQNCVVHGKWSIGMKVLCYGKNLSEVPSHLPTSVNSLDLCKNRILKLRESDFRNLSLLQFLNVSQNQIHLIEDGTFTHASNLKLLNLTSNNLTPSAFAPLMKLKVIDLTSNKLYSLTALGVVFKVKTLEELYIRENKITNFTTKDIVNVPMQLRELDASHNPISFIGLVTDDLHRLLSLDLSFSGTHNRVTWMLQDPCFLKELKRLYLGGILMSSLDIVAVIQKLNCSLLEEIHLNDLNLTDSDNLVEKVCLWHQNVRTLNLRGNKFKSIKGIVFENCTHLWHLDLTHNRLKVVPCASFQRLNSLQSLSLANNEFTSVPNATSNITSLKSLDLSFNHIRKIVPSDFANLKNLEILTLTGNRIVQINSGLFPDLHNLLELNLGMNRLLEISQPFLDSLGKLEKLEIKGNKMSSIKKETFKNLISLQFLNLVDNQIHTIEPGAFEGLSHLQTLLLGTNKITKETFQKGVFQGLSSLVELQLFDNYIFYETPGKLDNPPFILLQSLKRLYLNSQRNLAIIALDTATFKYTPALKELDLSSNLHLNRVGLQSLDFVLHVNFSKLILLRVSGNQLNVIESKHIKALPYLTFLDLTQNPFTCSCENKMFLNWSLHNLKTQVLYFYQYTCAFPLASKERKLWTFPITSCTVDHEFILFVTNTTIVILLMIVCICFRIGYKAEGPYKATILLET
uniref:Uncharacterized protein n=1 Tax=Pelusios castaneus TaxID=367368 RepID=A0A8C8RMN1_9SAUR